MPTKGKSLKTRLDTRGVIALQTVIIIAVLALGAAGGGIIIYNTVKDKTEDLAITDDVVEEFTSTKKEKLDVLVDPNNNTPGANLGPEVTARPEELEEDEEEDGEDGETEDDEETGQTGEGQTGSGGGGQTGGTGGGGTGDGETEEELPRIVGPVATEFKQISARTNHSCAIKGTERRVWCWGNNRYGQLGNGESGGNIEINFASPIAVQATELEETNIQSVAVGHQFSCALLTDKTIKCWGHNQNGQLGIGTAGGTSIVPVQVVGITTATSIAAGQDHACALLEDKTARCWGTNWHGQLGNGVLGGPDEPFPTPIRVRLGNIKSIAVGGLHTCALLEDKTARCWGLNTNGQLGIGGVNTVAIPTPAPVLDTTGTGSLGNIKSIALGNNHSCAVLEDKTARCWGLNNRGQLGDGTIERRTIPVPVLESPGTPLGNIVSIAAVGKHTCAVLEDKTAKCWGLNFKGQLGDGVIVDPDGGPFPTPTPTPVLESPGTPLGNIVSIAVGANHTCAILEDETALCWGWQNYGIVGNGWQNLDVSRYPVPVLETPSDES